MSTTSSGNLISIPNGGGSINGMGEKFSPDLFTGTGNFSVPIQLPPGRNEFQPELKLVYSTGNGNGPFGLGWDLSVPRIHRKTSDGVPVYEDRKDTFILSGAEDLIAIDPSDKKTEYRPRTEGMFARIIHHHDTENNFWEIQSKDGLVSCYGTPGKAGVDPAVIADPANRNHVFSWKLTKTTDLFGNRIEYTYERDNVQIGPHHWDQIYLQQIRYVDYTNDDGEEQFLVSVKFEYEERPDPFSQYKSGFEIRTRKRCKDIVVRTHASDEQKIRSYELWYRDEFINAGRLPSTATPHNGVSLLHQIQTIGHDERQEGSEERQQTLPPLKFGYTQFEPQERDFFAIKGDHLPAKSLANPDLELVDLFGNGLPDVLEMNGTVRYWRNLGNGRFDRPRKMRKAPGGLHLAYPGVQLLDADGNGQIDLLVTKDGVSGYFPTQTDGQWDRESFRRYRQAPSINLQRPDVHMTDLNGDGVTDAIRSGSSFECFFNDPEKGWHDIRRVERRELETFPNVHFEDPRVRWADMTGDGLQDIVLVYNGNLMYWPNLRHGNWGARIRMRQSPRFPESFDPENLLIGDVDGNGVADLIYVDHGKITLWINQSGNGWSEPIVIAGTPGFSSTGSVRLVDLHGTGISGILWSADATPLHRDHLFFLDLTGGIKPYLLNGMDNNVGAITRVEYAPSTRFYLEDEKHPQTRWKSTLPLPTESNVNRKRIFFPHQVVQRTTQWERGDDPMTQFTFTDSYDDFGQPCKHTKIAMPRREAKRKKVTAAVVGEMEGDEVNETRILATHTHTEYASPDPDLYMHDRVAQVRTFELSKPPEINESDPENLARLFTDQAAAARTVHEQFRKASESEVKLTGHTLNHYDGEAFAGRAAGEAGPFGALTRSEALVFSETELEDAFGDRRPDYLGGTAALPEGAPEGFGQDPGYRQEQYNGDSHTGFYTDTERQRFDFQQDNTAENRGIVTAVQDSFGHQTTIDPDRFLLFPSRVVDPAGLETDAEYDYRALEPRQVTDPNGNTTHFRYTPLGLLHKQFVESHKGEGGTEGKPEIEYTYALEAYEKTRNHPTPQPIYVHTNQRIRHASDNASDETIESREYSDGFGRLIQTRVQAEELAFGKTGDNVGLSSEPGKIHGAASGQRVTDRVVVSGWQVFNNKGEVIEEYEPFFGDGWEYQPGTEAKSGRHVTHFYDPRGQLIRSVNPSGSEQRVIFGIPHRLETPDDFAPTPWESYNYDPNDLAPVSRKPDDPTESLEARVPEAHHFTPTNSVMDALGRGICQVERNGSEPETDWHIIRSSYDLRGNLLTVTDTLGREAFKHAYDLLDNELQVQSIDAGLRTSVFDATGNLVEYRDSKGSTILCQYDNANRLTHKWARDNDNSPVTLRERIIYGDDESGSDMDRDTAKQNNLLGQPFKHYDEAGLLTFIRYDFKGHPEEEVRQVISDTAIEDGWSADWGKTNAEDELEQFGYRTSIRYDALNRPLEFKYPEDADGHRAVLSPRYNRGGALEMVDLDDEIYVARIAYNAKGQRSLIAYGNGIMTRYAYNPNTFRLERLRTEKFEDSAPDMFEGKGSPLQDCTYSYDLAGNRNHTEHALLNSHGSLQYPCGVERF